MKILKAFNLEISISETTAIAFRRKDYATASYDVNNKIM
jgi:hypothetical protein